ncbi:MAG TPA: ATP-dependent Clp protease proteolytic subunit [Candidatus Paceibacterota bacterium]
MEIQEFNIEEYADHHMIDVFISGSLDQNDTPRNIQNQLSPQLNQLQSSSALNIYLESLGGTIGVSTGIYDYFDNLRKRKKFEIITHLTGNCSSAAIIIALLGDKRVLYPGANMVFHATMRTVSGSRNKQELLEMVEELQSYDDIQKKYYSRIGLTEAALNYLFDGNLFYKDRLLTHKQIIELGIATHVVKDYKVV